jgi:riboflavin kinase/FMN adenylyltransferase
VEIIAGTADFVLERETAAAIGKFDGVHIGHRRLLDEIIVKKQQGLDACVFTFNPPPAVLFGTGDGKELTTVHEKRILLERMGVDVLVEFPLDKTNAAMSPENFARDVLVKQLNTSFIAAGTDLSFGAGGKGNAALLEALSGELGFVVKTIEKVKIDDIEVSSSVIRGYVEAGNMPAAERMLGIPYPVMGKVEHGSRIGRTLGFPTVNIIPADSKLLPPNGVYDADVLYKGRKYAGVCNVGLKPTVSADSIMSVETYIYDFNEDIYGEDIEIYLKKFRRPERRFESVEELKAQLKRDIMR